VRKLFGSKKGKKRNKGKRVIAKTKVAKKSLENEEANISGKSGKKWSLRSLKRMHYVYGSLVIVGAIMATVALRVILGGVIEDADARTEYEQLRESFPAVAAQSPSPEFEAEEEFYEVPEGVEEDDDDWDLRNLSLEELNALNNDFVGWITVSPSIDYPVVQGRDNNKYINTTFLGHRNTAGAIFMDYRHADGFDEEVCILYGHNTRDGSMFSALVRYLDQRYLQENPNITITTRDGRRLSYRIFAARFTDAWDIAYTIGVNDTARAFEEFSGAPENINHFLLLSTCTRNANDDERVLIFAAR